MFVNFACPASAARSLAVCGRRDRARHPARVDDAKEKAGIMACKAYISKTVSNLNNDQTVGEA
jgi:hypothetical protein